MHSFILMLNGLLKNHIVLQYVYDPQSSITDSKQHCFRLNVRSISVIQWPRALVEHRLDRRKYCQLSLTDDGR